jgi:hypothetical protein
MAAASPYMVTMGVQAREEPTQWVLGREEDSKKGNRQCSVNLSQMEGGDVEKITC